MPFVHELLRDRTGATAIEYGLIAALIAVASIAALSGTGSEIANTMNVAGNAMAEANSGV